MVFTAAARNSVSGSVPTAAGFWSPPHPARISAATPAVAPRPSVLLLTTDADHSGQGHRTPPAERRRAPSRERYRRSSGNARPEPDLHRAGPLRRPDIARKTPSEADVRRR